MPEIIGDYQYSKRDLIGHGAFAIVFLGHSRIVRFDFHLNFSRLIFSLLINNVESRTTSRNQTNHQETISQITKFIRKRNQNSQSTKKTWRFGENSSF